VKKGAKPEEEKEAASAQAEEKRAIWEFFGQKRLYTQASLTSALLTTKR
jgi:hypothetical protein